MKEFIKGSIPILLMLIPAQILYMILDKKINLKSKVRSKKKFKRTLIAVDILSFICILTLAYTQPLPPKLGEYTVSILGTIIIFTLFCFFDFEN